jgi:hypothetical protein
MSACGEPKWKNFPLRPFVSFLRKQEPSPLTLTLSHEGRGD